jgi:hypothetical protein
MVEVTMTGEGRRSWRETKDRSKLKSQQWQGVEKVVIDQGV